MTVRSLVELTCKEVVELITEYMSRAMAEEDQARLEQHLFICAPCTAHLGQVSATIELANQLGEEAPPTGVDGSLVALFRQWRKP